MMEPIRQGWAAPGQHADSTLPRYDLKRGWLKPGDGVTDRGLQYVGTGEAGFDPSKTDPAWHTVISPKGVAAPIDAINYTPATRQVHAGGMQAPINEDNVSLMPLDSYTFSQDMVGSGQSMPMGPQLPPGLEGDVETQDWVGTGQEAPAGGGVQLPPGLEGSAGGSPIFRQADDNSWWMWNGTTFVPAPGMPIPGPASQPPRTITHSGFVWGLRPGGNSGNPRDYTDRIGTSGAPPASAGPETWAENPTKAPNGRAILQSSKGRIMDMETGIIVFTPPGYSAAPAQPSGAAVQAPRLRVPGDSEHGPFDPPGYPAATGIGPSVPGMTDNARAGLKFSPYDPIIRKHAGDLGGNDEFVSVVAAAILAESMGDPNAVGDGGKSKGIYQIHDANMLPDSVRLDPDQATAFMMPRFIAAYNAAKAQGLAGAALAEAVAMEAERPQDTPEARARYRNAFGAITSQGPGAFAAGLTAGGGTPSPTRGGSAPGFWTPPPKDKRTQVVTHADGSQGIYDLDTGQLISSIGGPEKEKPQTVGNRIVKFNPETGQYDTVYTAPKNRQFSQAGGHLFASDPETGQTTALYSEPGKPVVMGGDVFLPPDVGLKRHAWTGPSGLHQPEQVFEPTAKTGWDLGPHIQRGTGSPPPWAPNTQPDWQASGAMPWDSDPFALGTGQGAVPPIDPSQIVGGGNKFGQQVSMEGTHHGTDLQAYEGTPVVSPVRGVVEAIESEPEGLGLQVRIRGDDGSVHTLAHLLDSAVQQGDTVEQGQVVARVGESGAGATGPHLDYRIQEVDGSWRNPEPQLGPLGQLPEAPNTVPEQGVGRGQEGWEQGKPDPSQYPDEDSWWAAYQQWARQQQGRPVPQGLGFDQPYSENLEADQMTTGPRWQSPDTQFPQGQPWGAPTYDHPQQALPSMSAEHPAPQESQAWQWEFPQIPMELAGPLAAAGAGGAALAGRAGQALGGAAAGAAGMLPRFLFDPQQMYGQPPVGQGQSYGEIANPLADPAMSEPDLSPRWRPRQQTSLAGDLMGGGEQEAASGFELNAAPEKTEWSLGPTSPEPEMPQIAQPQQRAQYPYIPGSQESGGYAGGGFGASAGGGAAGPYNVAFGFNQAYSNPFNAAIPNHRGVDLVIPGAENNGRGSPVGAFQGGTVVAVTQDPNGGNGVILQGVDGLYHRYFHFDSIGVKQGQQVAPGQPLGTLGASGTEGFPHVHFEVSRGINGDPMDALIDPTPYMSGPPGGRGQSVGMGQDVGIGEDDPNAWRSANSIGFSPFSSAGPPPSGWSPTPSGSMNQWQDTGPTIYETEQLRQSQERNDLQRQQIENQAAAEDQRHQEAMAAARTDAARVREQVRHDKAMEEIQRASQELQKQEMQLKAYSDAMARNAQYRIQGTFGQQQQAKLLQSALTNPWLQNLSGMAPGYGRPGWNAISGGGVLQSLLNGWNPQQTPDFSYQEAVPSGPKWLRQDLKRQGASQQSGGTGSQQASSAGGGNNPIDAVMGANPSTTAAWSQDGYGGYAPLGSAPPTPEYQQWRKMSPFERASWRTLQESAQPFPAAVQDTREQWASEGVFDAPNASMLSATQMDPMEMRNQNMTAEMFGQSPQDYWKTNQKTWSSAAAPSVSQQT